MTEGAPKGEPNATETDLKAPASHEAGAFVFWGRVTARLCWVLPVRLGRSAFGGPALPVSMQVIRAGPLQVRNFSSIVCVLVEEEGGRAGTRSRFLHITTADTSLQGKRKERSMKKLESPMHSKVRTASLLSAAILTTTFAFLPAAVHAQGYSPQDEHQLEQSCKDWEKVRRCANAAGEVQIECVAKSPMAKFWAMLKGERKQDDEVKVEVIRRAPENTAPATTENQADARQARGSVVVEGRHTERSVKTGKLPRCQDNG